jgi:hypothetical protein
MPIAPINTYTTKNRLDYLFPDIPHPEINVALATGSYAQGTIIGEVTATPGTYAAYSNADVAAPAAPVPAALGSGGTFAAGAYTVVATYRNGVGETTASPTAGVTLIANGAIALPAVTLPSGATGVAYYVSETAGSPDVRFVVANAGAAVTVANPPAAGAANPPAANTATAATNGAQNPALILMYACVVDASGNITLGTSGVMDFGQTFGKAAPAYMGGSFRCQELVGFDANALAHMDGRLVEGTVASGIVII